MEIEIINGDITKIEADVIVNAANSSLLGGGGVDGAIHRKGGKEILEACRDIIAKQGRCNTGEAVITTAGKLPAKYVIHTVGPVWNKVSKNEGKETLLANCYRNSIKLAVENGAKTIAFPNISTGIYHFPKHHAANIVFDVIKDLNPSIKEKIQKIIFVCYDKENEDIYRDKFSFELDS